jgi:sugar lactone lactonase YvrE
MSSKPELVLDSAAVIGEGPVWEPVSARLIWVDIPAGLVHLFDPASGRDDATAMGQSVGVAVLGPEGSLVVACGDGFYSLELATGEIKLLAHVEADMPGSRMNDGACDALGRFWAGTMSDAAEPGVGSLYRFDADRRVTRILSNLTISNGIGWSLNNSLMYYVDSPTQTVDVFDFDLASGSVAGRRTLVSIPAEEGMPDGLTVDSEGCIWVALWGGSEIRRYDQSGALLDRYHFPVEYVSSCGFGGSNLDELYVTTARYTLDAGARKRQPGAGGIFRVLPNAKGRPANRWAGSVAADHSTARRA